MSIKSESRMSVLKDADDHTTVIIENGSFKRAIVMDDGETMKLYIRNGVIYFDSLESQTSNPLAQFGMLIGKQS